MTRTSAPSCLLTFHHQQIPLNNFLPTTNKPLLYSGNIKEPPSGSTCCSARQNVLKHWQATVINLQKDLS